MRGLRLSRTTGIRVGAVALVLLAGLASVVYIHGSASAAQKIPLSHLPYNPEHSSAVPAGAKVVGHHNGKAQLQIEIVLHPQHENKLYSLIEALSTPGSSLYQHWLTPAQFNAEFPAPAFNSSWLTSHGIRRVPGPSPLVLVFSGTSSQFEAAFNTTINDYRTKSGRTVYANDSAPSVPSTSFSAIAGIVGLDNVTSGQIKPELAKPLKATGKGTLPGYGAGPGGNGLTPSQVQSIYNAGSIYHISQGKGVTTALFELSGYPQSDIRGYEKAFHLPHTKIQNINVDGGSCPAAVLLGYPCDYGAIEDDIDIELQEAMAPGISKIQVYLGPNSDQGTVDTYFAIANQNTASVVSTSWGQCESSLDAGVAYGEYLAFAQMAAQGQSISAAAGDNGSYDCVNALTSPPIPSYAGNDEVDDPASDPLMTAAGGTSFFGTFDPGTNAHPLYPSGSEYVWDTLNNCSNSDFVVFGVDISSAYGLCPFGGGGGGDSVLWAMAPWQKGPGTISPATKFGSYCGAAAGAPCREVPDISLNADPNSGYAEYCSDPAAGCSSASPWVQIGGTSCSSPLWSGIVAIADSAGHHRVGLVTPFLYSLDNSSGYGQALHDMQGGGKFTFDWSSFLGTTEPPVTIFTNSNGYGTPAGFTETPDYDMATGLGTPNVSAIVPLLER